MPELCAVTARWVFPAADPPLERRVLVLDGDRIRAIEPHGRRTPDFDFGNAAILPGLVNAHTHLDLSGMRGVAPPSPDFPAWLRQVIGHRRARASDDVRAAIRSGIAESSTCGTTLVG